MGRSPVRTAPTRADVPAGEKKVRIRRNAAMQSALDIPPDILRALQEDYGVDVQWVADSVLGKPEPQMRMSYEINAWEPVTPDMFGGILDGLFTRKGHKGEIDVGGVVLMWRPMELTQEARAEERAAQQSALAAQARMVMSGALPGFSPGFEPDHPTALKVNTLARSVKPPMEIPRE